MAATLLGCTLLISFLKLRKITVNAQGVTYSNYATFFKDEFMPLSEIDKFNIKKIINSEGPDFDYLHLQLKNGEKKKIQIYERHKIQSILKKYIGKTS